MFAPANALNRSLVLSASMFVAYCYGHYQAQKAPETIEKEVVKTQIEYKVVSSVQVCLDYCSAPILIERDRLDFSLTLFPTRFPKPILYPTIQPDPMPISLTGTCNF